MRRLSRKANVLVFGVCIIVFVGVSYIFMNRGDNEELKDYAISLVAENQKLSSCYVDALSQEQTSSKYQKQEMILEKGTKIDDMTLSSKQVFEKYLKLSGPDGEETLNAESDQVITHYAYSLLLIGDIEEKVDIKTQEKTYSIVNARITYDKIPFVLLDNNVILITNKEKNKEKKVELQDFINALKDVDKRNEMISW